MIDELLPHEPPMSEAAGDEAEPAIAKPTTAHQIGVLLNWPSPLDSDDIRIFPDDRGIDQVGTLIKALGRTNLLTLAQLAFDLEDVLAVWHETRWLDSRLAVLERGLDRRLPPPRGGPSRCRSPRR